MFDKLKRRFGLHKGNEGKELALAAEILEDGAEGLARYNAAEFMREDRQKAGLVINLAAPILIPVIAPFVAAESYFGENSPITGAATLLSLGTTIFSATYALSGVAAGLSALFGTGSIAPLFGSTFMFWTMMPTLYVTIAFGLLRWDERGVRNKLPTDPDELTKLKLATARKLIADRATRDTDRLEAAYIAAQKLVRETIDSHDCTGEECEVCEDLRTIVEGRDLIGETLGHLASTSLELLQRIDAFNANAVKAAEAKKLREAAELETSKQISAAVEQQMLEEGQEARAAREAEIAANRERARVRLLGSDEDRKQLCEAEPHTVVGIE